jgi:ABC-2 type transport system permease protein
MTDARILDRGYRPYDGPRLGTRGAMRSLAAHSAQRALGLRRPVSAKLFPVLSAAIAYLPALVFVGMAAFLPDDLIAEGILPTYPQYYGFVTSAIIVFTAFVAPEVLCPDRRNGLLGLYLASPLSRDTYLASKAAAVMGVLSLVTTGPLLLLLLAYTFEGSGPAGPDDFLLLFVRIVVAGALISAVYTSISLAASAATDRRAFASAGVILLLLVSSIVTVIVAEELEGPAWIWCFNLLAMPFELAQHVFGAGPEIEDGTGLSMVTVVGANLAWTAAASAFVWVRYRKLAVTR